MFEPLTDVELGDLVAQHPYGARARAEIIAARTGKAQELSDVDRDSTDEPADVNT